MIVDIIFIKKFAKSFLPVLVRRFAELDKLWNFA